MSNFRSLSETEMELMKEIWKIGRPVTSNELLTIFSKKRARNGKVKQCQLFYQDL